MAHPRSEFKLQLAFSSKIAHVKDCEPAVDCPAVADGTLAQRRQRRRIKTMMKICHYSSLTPLCF
jgi:hypothetical protein